MIVALLVLIVLILLFGAAAVRGWIANAVVMGFCLVAIALALIWVGSFFGPDGTLYILGGLCVVMLLLAAWKAVPPSPLPPDLIVPPKPKPRSKATERAWQLFADDIANRFSPVAREEAHRLYEAGETRELYQFCRREVERLD